MKFIAPLTIGLALALAACSSSKPPVQAETAPAAPPPPGKTVYDAQFKALQKAKDVQKTVDEQKADLDRKVQEDGG